MYSVHCTVYTVCTLKYELAVIFTHFPSTASDFTYPVRLVFGSKYSEGTVEVYSNSQKSWGMICDYGWGMQEANVVCRMLGFEGLYTHV